MVDLRMTMSYAHNMYWQHGRWVVVSCSINVYGFFEYKVACIYIQNREF